MRQFANMADTEIRDQPERVVVDSRVERPTNTTTTKCEPSNRRPTIWRNTRMKLKNEPPKSLDGYNTRDTILGNVVTWSDRPEHEEQKRHKTEHKARKITITIPISPLPPNAAERKDKRRKYTELLYLNSQSTKVQKRAAVSLLVAPVLYPTLLRRCQFYVNPPATQWNVFHNVQLCTTLATKVLSDYWW